MLFICMYVNIRVKGESQSGIKSYLPATLKIIHLLSAVLIMTFSKDEGHVCPVFCISLYVLKTKVL